MTRRLRELNQAMFSRSYLLTIGFLMFAGASFVGYIAWSGSLRLELWGVLLTTAFVFCGALLFAAGVFGSNARMAWWADIASRHEAAIILVVISYPVYLILKLFHRPR